MIVVAASFAWLAFMPYDVSFWQLGAAIFLQGVGSGLFMSPNISMIMSSVPADKRGVASGMRATTANVAQSLSMTVYFAILIISLEGNLKGTILEHIPASAALFSIFLGIAPPGIPFKSFMDAFAPGFHDSMVVLFVISAVMSVAAAALAIAAGNGAIKGSQKRK